MKKKTHSVDVLFMLILFSVFAVMSVLLILIGSNVYGNITNTQERNSNTRNILSYVTNKIRTSQVENGVYIEEKDGTPVLVIEDSYDDNGFKTLIFEKNGKLKEATVIKNNEYNLEFGDVLSEIDMFNVDIDKEKNIVTLTVAYDGIEKTADIFVGVKH